MSGDADDLFRPEKASRFLNGAVFLTEMYAGGATPEGGIRPVIYDQRNAIVIGYIFYLFGECQKISVIQGLFPQLNHRGAAEDGFFHCLGQRFVFRIVSVCYGVEPDEGRIYFHDVFSSPDFFFSDMFLYFFSDLCILPGNREMRYGPLCRTV